MAMTKTLTAYADVHQVLSAAVEHSGGTYLLESKAAATYWIMRANQYRRQLLLQKGIEPFAQFTFRHDPEAPGNIIIRFNDPVGVLRSPTGELIEPARSLPEDIFPDKGFTTPAGDTVPVTDEEKAADDLVARIREGKQLLD